MARILFAWELGGDYGHLARLLPVAQALKAGGHEVVFAVRDLLGAEAILAPHQIRSNTIAPTFIETPLTAPMFEDAAFKASVLAKIKLGRIGQPEDLMGAVLFLAGQASAMMTGTSLIVDGGWTAD